jgi:glycosyltransferase involved in cell wall biosynthesis
MSRARDQKCKMIVIGPDPDGLGGISRVTKIWRENGMLAEPEILYLPTVTDRPGRRYLVLLESLFRYFWNLLSGVGCIYIHSSASRSFYRKSVFILCAALLRRRIILHIHPSHFYSFVIHSKGLVRWYIDFVVCRVDRLIVLSQEMKSNMATLFPETPVSVLPNPVDLREMANGCGWRRRDSHLLYLGWYIAEKGVYDLVDAIEILVKEGRELQLDMFGTKQVDRLRHYVGSKNLDDVIKVNGWISGQDKIRALYECAVLVLPSYSEGMPNVILEAMATETPIISTAVGGLKEILKDGENAVIVPVNDPIKLSEAIARCLADGELRKRIARRALENAKSAFDIDAVKLEWHRILAGENQCVAR